VVDLLSGALILSGREVGGDLEQLVCSHLLRPVVRDHLFLFVEVSLLHVMSVPLNFSFFLLLILFTDSLLLFDVVVLVNFLFLSLNISFPLLFLQNHKLFFTF
jgi:hypothetical protein